MSVHFYLVRVIYPVRLDSEMIGLVKDALQGRKGGNVLFEAQHVGHVVNNHLARKETRCYHFMGYSFGLGLSRPLLHQLWNTNEWIFNNTPAQ